jgi:hypothetical protein
MRSSVQIAATTAISLAASMFVVLFLTTHSSVHFGDLLAPIAGGLLVGLGTYLGSRWAPPYQRSARLARVLGALFFGLGVVLTFPHKTHAIKIDMPVAGGATSSVDVFVDVALGLIATSAVVLFSMLITRSIAALCRPRSPRET